MMLYPQGLGTRIRFLAGIGISLVLMAGIEIYSKASVGIAAEFFTSETVRRDILFGCLGVVGLALVIGCAAACILSRLILRPLDGLRQTMLADSGRQATRCADGIEDLVSAYAVIAGNNQATQAALQAEVVAHKVAQDELEVANLIYTASSEAMMVSDAQNRIQAVNPAFLNITGYQREDVLGRNPKFLGSGRQDIVFYQQMWTQLTETGSWQGEIWNRRKNGEVYAEWLSINSIVDQDGAVKKYVALFSDITQRKRAEEQLWQRANYDELTGLPNRRLFQDRLDQELKKAKRTDTGLALFFVDLDHFKEINDALGHELGDLLLVEATQRLRACVRDMDTVARLGGDEFTVILVDFSDHGIIERIAQDINRRLAQPFSLLGEMVHSSASIGITLFPNDGDNITSLLKQADQAMYSAKAEGRNRYRYFTPAIQEAAHVRSRLINDLHTAVAENQFRVHFQPIVNINTGVIEKAEVLVRWEHPRMGLVYPDYFIPAAEETGLIVAIGNWVFKEATFQLKQWIDKTGRPIQISINASPVQFTEGIDIDNWMDHLDRLGVPGSLVIIEITEGLFLHPTPLVIEQLNTLRRAGLQVAIDDFGTGYSALSYLRHFEIDLIKIDQSFVRNLGVEGNDLALSEAIIVMAHKLGYQVIAEGVETIQQMSLLSGVDCDQAQGFLISKPVPAEAFETLLLKNDTHYG